MRLSVVGRIWSEKQIGEGKERDLQTYIERELGKSVCMNFYSRVHI